MAFMIDVVYKSTNHQQVIDMSWWGSLEVNHCFLALFSLVLGFSLFVFDS